MRYKAVCFGRQVTTFRRYLMSPSSRYKNYFRPRNDLGSSRKVMPVPALGSYSQHSLPLPFASRTIDLRQYYKQARRKLQLIVVRKMTLYFRVVFFSNIVLSVPTRRGLLVEFILPTSMDTRHKHRHPLHVKQ